MRELPGEATVEQRVAALASCQKGRVARAQLLAAGLSSSRISRLLARGYLIAEHAGVYAVGHIAEVEGGREASALLAVRAGGLLSHLSALSWWQLLAPRQAAVGEAATAAVHVTVAGHHGGRPAGVVMHRSIILTRRDRRHRRGLPVASPARALLDCAPELAPRELERALDQGLVAHVLRLAEVRELLARAGRHPGRGALEALLATHGPTTATRSDAEERFLALVREAGLSPPLVNTRRAGHEVDFLWPDAGLAVEIDGFAFHADRNAFERDRRRDADLRAIGIGVTRVTWRQLVGDPLGVVARLAGALARSSSR